MTKKVIMPVFEAPSFEIVRDGEELNNEQSCCAKAFKPFVNWVFLKLACLSVWRIFGFSSSCLL